MYENMEECLIDYSTFPKRCENEVTRKVDALLKSNNVQNANRFSHGNIITYKYVLTSNNEKILYKINVDRRDELSKAKLDAIFFRVSNKLKNIKLFKTKLIAAVLVASTAVTAYNLPKIIKNTPKILSGAINRIEQHFEDAKRADGNYTKEEWNEVLNGNSNYSYIQPTEEEKEAAKKTYYANHPEEYKAERLAGTHGKLK